MTANPPLLSICPLCGDPGFDEMYRFEPALWIPGRVVRCSGCGAVYKKPSAEARPLWDYYRDSKYRELHYWAFDQAAARALQRTLDAVVSVTGSPGSRSLLEIGCGTGQFLQLAQQRGFDVSGVELNAEHAAEARRRTNGGPILCGDFMIESFDRQFDVIAMLDLIEHLPDPLAALRRSYELLKPGGHVVVYTPNHSGITPRVADLAYRVTGGAVAGPVKEIFDCLHVVFFDVASLRSALERSGFGVARLMLSPYDPSRNDQATGVSAVAVRLLESVGSVCFGQFRMLMLGRKPEAGVRG